jgi:WD40 repeat protein
MIKNFLITSVFIAFCIVEAFSQDQAILKINRSHTRGVADVAISPDEKLVVSGASDHTLKVWDVATGREIHTLRGHSQDVSSVKFSSDGKKILSGGWDGAIKLWDVTSGKVIKSIQTKFRSVNTVNFYKNDNYVVSTGDYIAIHDLKTDSLVKKIDLFRNYIGEFSMNSNGYACAEFDYRSVLVDLEKGEKIRDIPGFNKNAISSDGNLIVNETRTDSLQLYDIASGKILRRFHLDASIWKIAFSPDGKNLAVGSTGVLTVFDVATGNMIHQSTQPGEMRSLAYSKTGKYLVTGTSYSMDAGIVLLNARTFKVIRKFGANMSLSSHLKFTRDGKSFYTKGSPDDMVRKWNLSTMKIEETRTFERGSFAFSKDLNFTLVYNERGVSIQKLAQRETLISAIETDLAIASQDGEIVVFLKPGTFDLQVNNARSNKPIQTIHSRYKMSISAMAISPDKHYCATAYNESKRLVLWDLISGEEVQVTDYQGYVDLLKFLDNKTLLFGREDKGEAILQWHSIPSLDWKSKKYSNVYAFFNTMLFTPDNQFMYLGQGDYGLMDRENGPILKINLKSGSIAKKFVGHKAEVSALALSNDGKYLVSGSTSTRSNSESELRVWDANTGKLINTITSFEGGVDAIDIAPDASMILASGSDNTIRLFRIDGTELVAIIPLNGSADYIAMTPDGYFTSTKAAHGAVHYVKNGKIYPFEQFDLQYNRPDIILSRIGKSSPEIVKAYERAYRKRLKKMKIDETAFELTRTFNIPEVQLTSINERLFSVAEKSLSLTLKAQDPLYNLVSLHIRINGVPIHGINGIDLRPEKSKEYQTTLLLDLASGSNLVEVTALNEKGVESLAERFDVTCEVNTKPNLFVIAIGVSDFMDNDYDLTYAAKDATDLADLCNKSASGFAKVNVLKLLDQQVTNENTIKIKELLKHSKPDDEVILFVASHGVLDENLDYYIGTHDMEFENPSGKGLLYDNLEALLDGIGARKKLLLIDACHSGEIDKEENVLVASVAVNDGAVKNRGFKGVKRKEGLGLENSFDLMNELFSDIRKGSGTIVISSASGTEFAFESVAWKNGVFTYAFLDGLSSRKADKDNDTLVKVSEIRDYVIDKVVELTQGKQHPTIRKENLEFDFRIW